MPDPTSPNPNIAATATASTPAPAAAAAVSTTVPPPYTVSDVTPNQSRVHRVLVPKANVSDFIRSIDPTAPEGKTVRMIVCGFDGKGDMTVTITYAP
jgi:hypothetical protein